jgi:hypothetical protein
LIMVVGTVVTVVAARTGFRHRGSHASAQTAGNFCADRR